MGYMGTRLLVDRENPGHYFFVVDFGVIDPDVSAAEEAARNNERPETQAFAARMLEVVATASPSGATTTSCTARIDDPRRGRHRVRAGRRYAHRLPGARRTRG